MKKKKLVVSLIIIVALFILMIPLLLISPILFQIRDIQHLEKRMCSPEYYEPVAKDLALICSKIKSDITLYAPDTHFITWLPDSVKRVSTFDYFNAFISSNEAHVLYTGGFTHLSYKLEKAQRDSEGSNKWELYFDDEGAKKFLTTVELSETDSLDFNSMFEKINDEFESMKHEKEQLQLLFGEKMNDQLPD